MRVALAAFGHTASGMEVGAVDAALGLSERGVDVVLLADADAHLPDRAAPLRDALFRMRERPSALRGARRENAMFLIAKMWRAREVARAARACRVDVIHAYSPGLVALAPKGMGVLAQAWMSPPGFRARWQVMSPFARGGPLLKPAYALREAQAEASDRSGYRRADMVLAATDGATEALQRMGIRAATVPPPICPPPPPAPRGATSGLHLAFCGSPLARPRKGLRFLLDALELVPTRPLTVTLFGAGDAATEARAAVLRERGIDVRLPGHVPREAYLAALRENVDALVFTSLYEEWGYAGSEAMAHGVPVIAFAVHPFREVITPEVGVLAGHPSASALAGAITAAAGGALPARDVVYDAATARFGHRAIARQLVDRYAEVLG
jgi:glycosyltransferase involved in cell wall biosynthesis